MFEPKVLFNGVDLYIMTTFIFNADLMVWKIFFFN